jgi:alpha-L-rhamnosidase
VIAGAPHQTYAVGHEIEYEYIGDFNNANMTNVYIVKEGGGEIDYTPHFSTAGFRYVTVSGLPSTFTPPLSMLTSHFTHTDVRPYGTLDLAPVDAEGNGTFSTPDVLNGIHHLTRYSQMSNLMSVPTDCPQRERRGWMGDAQVTSQEAMLSFDMQTFVSDRTHGRSIGRSIHRCTVQMS